jgi:guanylate kinase
MITGLPHRPCPLVLAAPSGTGKTTIAHALVERFSRFVFSVSATTRAPRGDEVDGVDYDFLSRAEFEAMIEAGALVEWAEVHGNLYGTPVRNLEAAAARGEHVVLDIDVQGARQIRDKVPDAVLMFVFPPRPRPSGAVSRPGAPRPSTKCAGASGRPAQNWRKPPTSTTSW